jgi:hypothetical protein
MPAAVAGKVDVASTAPVRDTLGREGVGPGVGVDTDDLGVGVCDDAMATDLLSG